MPGVELRHLQTLAAIGEEGTLTGAGEALGYSQSAVSQQLTALERLVGQRLVERTAGARSVTLTPAGRRLAEHAGAIREHLAAARADLDASAGERDVTVRVAGMPSVVAALLPGITRRLRVTAPLARLVVAESDAPETLLDELRSARHDIVLGPEADVADGLEVVELGRDPYVVIAPAGHRLASLRRPLAARDLAGAELIAKECQRGIAAALEQHGLRFSERMRVHDARTVRELVAAGLGIAIVPRLAAYPGEDVVALSLEGVVADRVIALHVRAGARLGTAASAFKAAAIVVARDAGRLAPQPPRRKISIPLGSAPSRT